MSDNPTIQFPCSYPIRIIGIDGDDFARRVLEVVRQHADGINPDEIGLRRSSGGRYISVAVTLIATGEPQLKALHKDLLKISSVKLVL